MELTRTLAFGVSCERAILKMMRCAVLPHAAQRAGARQTRHTPRRRQAVKFFREAANIAMASAVKHREDAAVVK
jgi:hypothetical protein